MSSTDTDQSFADPLLQRPYIPRTELTEEQIEKARLLISTDYWGLSCWTCRYDGHTTFTSVHLTPSQRLYLAYCYYVYQCKTNPHMTEWYKQRRAARDRRDYSNIPSPPQSTGRPGRGRGRGAPTAGRGGSSRRPYTGGRERDSQKRYVTFGRSNGVYIATPGWNEPTHPSWADIVSDPDDEDHSPMPGNESGQGGINGPFRCPNAINLVPSSIGGTDRLVLSRYSGTCTSRLPFQ